MTVLQRRMARIFIPVGAEKTFAEMTMDEKKQFSHRAKALSKLIVFLKQK